jgi:hypothetical protein
VDGRRGVGRRVLAGVRGCAREITPAEEGAFLAAKRPDGPVFGWIADGSSVSHIVAPTFTRGNDLGWFFAHCYRCGIDERFTMHDATYFDPFTGASLTRRFSEACADGNKVRAERMRRRKALRDANKVAKKQ